MNIDLIFNITDRDRELYNLYSRMTDLQLLDLNCDDRVCRIVKFERLNDKGDASKFASMSISGLLPILSSFPTFDEGLAFIESFKPGFRYTKYFKQFAESYIKVDNNGNTTTYKLGDYTYSRKVTDEGIIREELYRYKGMRHRVDGPAYVEYYKNERPKVVTYWNNGKIHNENGPSSVEYYKSGNIRYVAYLVNGNFHRIDGPAITEYYENGKPEEEVYYINGVITKDYGPARMLYYTDGDIWKEEYYRKGQLCRTEGPSVIEYYEGKILANIQFYKNGKLDNGDEPAVITYDTDGNITYEKFYKNGTLINTRRK